MPYDIVISDGARRVVVALCSDYERRKKAIEEHTVTPRTENEYKYYNYKIYDATAEIIGRKNAERMIADIGAERGFAKSDITDFAEAAYKYKKRTVIGNIAKSLHYAD